MLNYVARKNNFFLVHQIWSSSNQLSCVCPEVLHSALSIFNITLAYYLSLQGFPEGLRRNEV